MLFTSPPHLIGKVVVRVITNGIGVPMELDETLYDKYQEQLGLPPKEERFSSIDYGTWKQFLELSEG